MRYAFIDQHRDRFSVTALCRALGVGKSAYHAYCHRGESRRRKANTALLEAIRKAHHKSHETYGSPRITQELKAQGIACSENRVARVMQAHAIRSRTARKFTVTTLSKHTLPVAPELLGQDFAVDAPNRVWVSDITYLRTRERWMYLAVVIDLYSRQVVGWSLRPSLDAALVVNAMNKALAHRRTGPGLIVHSDRGGQYASQAFRDLLNTHRFKQSMSRKGNCYDNAVAESFFKTLKTELIYPWGDFQSVRIARRSLFYYINFFYNGIRLHSYLGYKSPRQFEKLTHAT